MFSIQSRGHPLLNTTNSRSEHDTSSTLKDKEPGHLRRVKSRHSLSSDFDSFEDVASAQVSKSGSSKKSTRHVRRHSTGSVPDENTPLVFPVDQLRGDPYAYAGFRQAANPGQRGRQFRVASRPQLPTIIERSRSSLGIRSSLDSQVHDLDCAQPSDGPLPQNGQTTDGPHNLRTAFCGVKSIPLRTRGRGSSDEVSTESSEDSSLQDRARPSLESRPSSGRVPLPAGYLSFIIDHDRSGTNPQSSQDASVPQQQGSSSGTQHARTASGYRPPQGMRIPHASATVEQHDVHVRCHTGSEGSESPESSESSGSYAPSEESVSSTASSELEWELLSTWTKACMVWEIIRNVLWS